MTMSAKMCKECGERPVCSNDNTCRACYWADFLSIFKKEMPEDYKAMLQKAELVHMSEIFFCPECGDSGDGDGLVCDNKDCAEYDPGYYERCNGLGLKDDTDRPCKRATKLWHNCDCRNNPLSIYSLRTKR